MIAVLEIALLVGLVVEVNDIVGSGGSCRLLSLIISSN